MQSRSTRSLFLAVVFVLCCCHAARALIGPKWHINDTYKGSQLVLVAKISRAAGTHAFEAMVVEVIKGNYTDEKILLQVQPEEIFKRVSVGQPIVVFKSGRATTPSTVHLADSWVLANFDPNTKPLRMNVVQEQTELRQSFPGQTTALVALVKEFQAGRSTFLNAVDDKIFSDGPRKLAQLKISGPSFILASDLDGDKTPELVIGAADGVHIIVRNGAEFIDVSDKWGMKGAAAALGAVGDIDGDGRPDLLLDKTLFLNNGRSLIRAVTLDLPPASDVLCAGFADLTADQRPDVVVLSRGGDLLIFENPGAQQKSWARQPVRKLVDNPRTVQWAGLGQWGESGEVCLMVIGEQDVTRYPLSGSASPADFLRLTGDPIANHLRQTGGKLQHPAALPIDINGDGKIDLMIVGEGGGMLLINRGFGAFLVSENAVRPLLGTETKPPLFTLKSTTCWTAADLRGDRFPSLLVLNQDGQLHEVPNTPRATGSRD